MYDIVQEFFDLVAFKEKEKEIIPQKTFLIIQS